MTEDQKLMAETLSGAMRSLNDSVREAIAMGLKVDLHLIKMYSSRSPKDPIHLLDLAVAVRSEGS
jgi:hypothetical protein